MEKNLPIFALVELSSISPYYFNITDYSLSCPADFTPSNVIFLSCPSQYVTMVRMAVISVNKEIYAHVYACMHIFNGIYPYDKPKVHSEGKFGFPEKNCKV